MKTLELNDKVANMLHDLDLEEEKTYLIEAFDNMASVDYGSTPKDTGAIKHVLSCWWKIIQTLE